jgi:hypothetical protein
VTTPGRAGAGSLPTDGAAPAARRRRATAVGPSGVGLAVAVLSALVQLGPVLGHGYVLVRDMAFSPHPPLTGRLLGLDSVPRAVPSDGIVALLCRVLPGDVVEDLVLVAIIVAAGWGAARLVPSRRLPATAAAAALYSWNPYLTERLRQGQWAALVGYAALPWIATACLSLRRGDRGSAWRLGVAIAAGASGGASAQLLGVLVWLPLTLLPAADRGAAGRLRRTGIALAFSVAFALPWAIPALTQPASAPADRVGAALFAARPDTPLGSIGSLASLGGIWNADVVPPGRGIALVAALALAVSLAALAALVMTSRRWPAGVPGALAVTAIASFALAAWGAVPGARIALAHVVASGSAGGLLRDGQRWLAPFVLVVAVGFGVLVELATDRLAVAAVLAVVPALLLPAAAWGSDGALSATSWPADWSRVTTAAKSLPDGPLLVLPWSSERAYPWNADHILTDPTDHWLAARVVGDQALRVGSSATPDADPLGRRIAAAAVGHGPLLPVLQAQGYAGVLVQRDQPGAGALMSRLAGTRLVVTTRTLELVAVPGRRLVQVARAPLAPAVAGDAVAAATALVALAGCALLRTRSVTAG